MENNSEQTVRELQVPDSKLDPQWRADDIGIFEIRKLFGRTLELPSQNSNKEHELLDKSETNVDEN
jgi:hypothetical protein